MAAKKKHSSEKKAAKKTKKKAASAAVDGFRFDPDARQYSTTNALALAQMANLAYQSRTTIRRTTKGWGFDPNHFRFFDREGTQGFAVANGDALIVAFRGTESEINDILTDVNVRFGGGPLGDVHEGFLLALGDVWRDVRDALDDLAGSSRSLWLTGHSLGAALATLAVAKLIERGTPVNGLYTYGSPRCGDKQFAAAFNASFSQAYRFVYGDDLVTRVPPRFIFGYRHVGNVRYIDENCGIRDGGSSEAPFLSNFLHTLETLRSHDLSALDDHSIANYLRCLRKKR